MRKIISLVLVVLLITTTIFSFTSCAKEETFENSKEENTKENQSNNNENIEDIAKSFIKNLTNNEYEKAYNDYNFDEKMKNAVNPQVLEQIMGQLQNSVGNFIDIVEVSSNTSSQYQIISVTCEFEEEFMNLNVVFNQENQIAGFNFSKPQGYEKSEKEDSNKPDNIEEHEVTVGDGEWKLPATLSLPKGEGNYPAVVLVHGSGPNDRDETIGPNKPFRDIAWELSSKGIAVLRYEKRTKEYQQKMVEIVDELTVKEEVIDDALKAVNLLKNHKEIDNSKIYVLGHSLGGYLIPRIGVQDEEIAGFIVLAGSTRPLEDMIVEQIQYLSELDGEISEEEQNQIYDLQDARDKIKSSDLDGNANSKELMGINANYWLDLRGYNPTEVAEKIDRPMLILQGDRDYQVTMEDYNNWKQALDGKSNVIFKVFEKLNHLFISGEGTPNPNEYSVEGKVSSEVIEYISTFINGQK